jgi:hypothetical protein
MALELNGTTGVSLVQDGVVVAADLNSALSDTIGKVKAWVNFNGQGTVAIRASYGVSSISDNGTGDYTINFTTAMVDANFTFAGSVGDGDHSSNTRTISFTSSTSSTLRILVESAAGTDFDESQIGLVVFR